MYTGTNDINKLGVFNQWNGASYSKYYGKVCGDVNGTSGELWPPVINDHKVAVFSPDICR